MTLRELRYLVALADFGHFGRAAEACHVSQPTLSTQLRKLEDDLGVVFFARTNKSLQITPIGRKIVDQARRVLAEADRIVELSREEATLPLAGPLALGAIPTLSPYLLPWLVPLLKERYPHARLILREDLTDGLIENLRAYRIDAILVALPIAGDDFEIRPLFDEPFFFACAADHPLAQAPAVADADLHRERLLLLTDGHCLRDQALAVCGHHHAKAADSAADFRATSLETLRRMVATGLGVTLLPALAAACAEREAIVVRPLQSGASRRIGLAWRRADPRGADLERFATLVRDHLPAAVTAV